MKYFFLFAHPEPEHSFQRSLLNAGVAALEGAGHDVRISNLYEMNFNAIASGEDFLSRRFPERLQYDREQKFAVDADMLAPDIKAEIDKIFWCDIFIVQFPLYWFSMPAIMKGWFDRVFVNSLVYGAGKRYETGGLAGRKAMICASTGGFSSMFEPDGLLGDIEIALWPIQHGTLHYTGFEVLPPHIAWAPVRSSPETCDAYHSAYAERLLTASSTAPLFFHPTSDFDASSFKMHNHIEPRSAGHRRL